MKATTLWVPLLTANLVLGARWTQKRREARAAVSSGIASTHSSLPMISVPESVPRMYSSRPLNIIEDPLVDLKYESALNNNTFITYSQNWAGALLVNASFTSVTGTIVVPTPTGANEATQSAGAAWVGIDGGTCSSAILQTGIDWYVTSSTVSYDAWYEWYPSFSFDFTGIPLQPGDSVRMTVATTSTTTGSVKIENLTTGTVVSQALSVTSSAALCETNAEWIVEDFESCDGSGDCALVPFADFGTVNFASCSAMQGGATITPGAAGENLLILDIQQNSQVLTSCAVNDATVGCTYV